MTTVALPVNDFHGSVRKRGKNGGRVTENFFSFFG